MQARTGVTCVDRMHIRYHGKGLSDSGGGTVGRNIKTCAFDDYASGTLSLVWNLAAKFPHPDTDRHIRHISSGQGLYAAKEYIYLYIPDDGFDMQLAEAAAGYKNSSLDHFYVSIGNNLDSASLLRRERVCGC